jgi:hypothetical protein
MKHTGSGKKNSKSNGSSPKKRPRGVPQYAVCVKNDDYAASLELRKLYQIVPDKSSSTLGLIRIVDESGEDYLYPSEYFLPVKLSPAIQKAVQLAS